MIHFGSKYTLYLLARSLINFGWISAVIETPFVELDTNDGEDEHEEAIDDGNVGHILHRVHHAVKHCFQFRHPLDGLEGSQHS